MVERLINTIYWVWYSFICQAGIEISYCQPTKVLRHTFVSYFMMNSSNIVAFIKILDHIYNKIIMLYAYYIYFVILKQLS